ncbi:DUF1028 domain-containing protein [soil metagenome]
MTYSILARDAASGEMGVASQSQALALGSGVPWALPGHGVIATQSMGEPAYGELGLEALRAGLTAPEALTALRSVDPHPERRQVAMIDGHGQIALYTGEACVAAAGDRIGDGCCAVANMVAGEAVWENMVSTFETTPGSLANRLLMALHAAEDAGGDIRGQRSAAVLVVQAERSGRPWQDTVMDHRVDDHEDPVAELERLVTATVHYQEVVGAFEQALDGDPTTAAERIDAVPAEVCSDQPDLTMWRAIVWALAHRDAEATDAFSALGRVAPQFIGVARGFADAGLVPPERLDAVLPSDRVHG